LALIGCTPVRDGSRGPDEVRPNLADTVGQLRLAGEHRLGDLVHLLLHVLREADDVAVRLATEGGKLLANDRLGDSLGQGLDVLGGDFDHGSAVALGVAEGEVFGHFAHDAIGKLAQPVRLALEADLLERQATMYTRIQSAGCGSNSSCI